MFACAHKLCYVGVKTVGSLQKLPHWMDVDLSCELWEEDENDSL